MRPTRRFSAPPKPAAPPPLRTHDFVSGSSDAFLARWGLAQERPRATTPAPRAVTKPTPKLPGPVLWTAPKPDPIPTKEDDTMSPEKELLLRALLTTPGDKLIRCPLTQREMTVSEFIQREMDGDGATVRLPSDQPANAPQGMLSVSREAVEALTPAQYAELETHGRLDNLTHKAELAYVQTRQGGNAGTYSTHVALDEQGRPVTVPAPSSHEHQ